MSRPRDFSPNSREFVERLRRRLASSAVTPSAIRNMGEKDLVKRARKYLVERVDLRRLSNGGARRFPRALDELTRGMQRYLRPVLRDGHTGWGPSRKLLNLYLRDCFYNAYMRRAYVLKNLERVLELPLDKDSGTYLIDTQEGKNLPKWPGVCKLDKDTSTMFQAVAKKVATDMNTHPVHVDVEAWRKGVG